MRENNSNKVILKILPLPAKTPAETARPTHRGHQSPRRQYDIRDFSLQDESSGDIFGYSGSGLMSRGKIESAIRARSTMVSEFAGKSNNLAPRTTTSLGKEKPQFTERQGN